MVGPDRPVLHPIHRWEGDRSTDRQTGVSVRHLVVRSILTSRLLLADLAISLLIRPVDDPGDLSPIIDLKATGQYGEELGIPFGHPTSATDRAAVRRVVPLAAAVLHASVSPQARATHHRPWWLLVSSPVAHVSRGGQVHRFGGEVAAVPGHRRCPTSPPGPVPPAPRRDGIGRSVKQRGRRQRRQPEARNACPRSVHHRTGEAVQVGRRDRPASRFTINDVDILNGTDLPPYVAAAICGADGPAGFQRQAGAGRPRCFGVRVLRCPGPDATGAAAGRSTWRGPAACRRRRSAGPRPARSAGRR